MHSYIICKPLFLLQFLFPDAKMDSCKADNSNKAGISTANTPHVEDGMVAQAASACGGTSHQKETTPPTPTEANSDATHSNFMVDIFLVYFGNI